MRLPRDSLSGRLTNLLCQSGRSPRAVACLINPPEGCEWPGLGNASLQLQVMVMGRRRSLHVHSLAQAKEQRLLGPPVV